MSKSILEIVNGMEYVDEGIKADINNVFKKNANVNQDEVIEHVLLSHKHVIEQLGNSYSAIVYDNLRNLERMGRWTSLGYIIRAAKDSQIAALQKVSGEDCKLSQTLLKSYKLERQFSNLSLEDKQRIMDIYNNE